jgi:hypothetical protein
VQLYDAVRLTGLEAPTDLLVVSLSGSANQTGFQLPHREVGCMAVQVLIDGGAARAASTSCAVSW